MMHNHVWQLTSLKFAALGLFLLALGGLLGLWVIGGQSVSGRLLPIMVGSVKLAGLTPEEATARLQISLTANPTVTITIQDAASAETEDVEMTLVDLGIQIDPAATVSRIEQLGQQHRWRAGWYLLMSYLRSVSLPASLTVNDAQLNQSIEALKKQIEQDEQDASLVFEQDEWHVRESVAGRRLDSSLVRRRLLSQLQMLDFTPIQVMTSISVPAISTADAIRLLPEAQRLSNQSIILRVGDETIPIEPSQLALWTELVASQRTIGQAASLRLNSSQIEAFVKTLALRVRSEAMDARVVFEGGAVRINENSQEGRALDEATSVTLITEAFLDEEIREVVLPLTILAPAVSSATLANLGLKELIGTATTSYTGSPDNRKHNIQNGVKFLNSRLLPPNQEFSVIASLGAIDDTTGYLPELVIKENQTIPEYGGGLCQVSTTLFRAALNAGLKITERQNHSYRVSYYERVVGPGLDATIYLPSPDLKFLNDTPGWILVQGTTNSETDEVTFELYGTKDGRRSEVGKPEVYDVTNPPAPIYAETDTLPIGETKQVEKPHSGAKTTVIYKVYKGDELLFEQTFRSTYKAWPARYLVGTGLVASSETESSGEASP